MSPEMSSVDRLKTRIPTGKGYLVAIAVGGLALLLAHFLLPILVHRRAAVSLWTLLVALAILLLLGLLFLVFSRAYAQAVHAATTRYAALLDSADAAVFLLALQPDGTPECILEANSLARQRAGYSVEALADLSPSALIAVEYAEEFRQLFAELATRGQALLETVAVAQDGQRTPVEVFARLTTSNKSQAFLFLREIGDRKRVEASLQEARATFRALNAASPLATISFDPAGNVTTWNPSAETLLGWREYEVYGRPLPLMADETQAEFAAICARVLAKETVRDLQATCRRKDDTLCTVSLTAAPILDPAGEASGITLQLADVTVANALQTEFISTQRTLTLVSEIKKTLFCATGESELLQQVCEILVAHGGYVAAWAGLAHEENGQRVLRPQACSGLELPTLAQLLVAVDAPRQTHDPLEHAMRLGIVQTLSRLTKVALPQPWLAEAHAQNVGSLMIIPLLVNLKPIGVLVIYAAQPEAFDDAETERLSEFSDDLAYGIEALRIPLERQRAQEDLLRSARQWRSTFDAIIDPVCVVDADGIINRCNRAASQLLEKSFDAVLGTSVCSMLHDSLLPPATCALVRATECKETAVETVARGDNWYRVTIDPMLDEQGEVQGAVHIMTDITEQMQRAEELKQNNRRLQSILDETITAIAKIAEMRDPYTAGHERRVSELACAIARVMDMPLPRIEGLRVGGMLHDIGKLYVPAEILSKTGALTAMEFGVIKAHPQAGYEVLKSIDFPWPVAQMVLQHHERLDGTGYPNGLVGNDILPEACILAVADVVESMASHRPYRPARGLPAALDEIQQRAGQVYDPDVVNACVTVFAEGLCRFEA